MSEVRSPTGVRPREEGIHGFKNSSPTLNYHVLLFRPTIYLEVTLEDQTIQRCGLTISGPYDFAALARVSCLLAANFLYENANSAS